MFLSVACAHYGIRVARRLGRGGGSVAPDSAVHAPRISTKGIASERAWRSIVLVLACDLGSLRSRRRYGAWNSIDSMIGAVSSMNSSKRSLGATTVIARVRT